ncbi:hypothetical protein LUZ61_009388 [Rhynchospora tenuis]|uniref:DNA-directed DNA polymerase family A palm domain-containing protein n=1 Tax=Rhynchospora tenuis TaxID=198213 RepID=A0AAD5ZXF1_9POAL|nr:hypothetical protein LUZ61_009388 [Rhynchospora tenuis]
MALSVRSGTRLSAPCSLSRLLFSQVRRSLCTWSPCAYPFLDSRRQGVPTFRQPEVACSSQWMTQDEIDKALAALNSTFHRLPRDEIKKSRLYKIRDSTLERVCAGRISLPYNIMLRKEFFCNAAAAEFEECLYGSDYESDEPMRRLHEDYKETDYNHEISLLEIRKDIEERQRLKADYVKRKEEQKGVPKPLINPDSSGNNFDSVQSSSNIATSEPSKCPPDEHNEMCLETKIYNPKDKSDVLQVEEASKIPPENPEEKALLHRKLQEQRRQEQLRANLLCVYDKILVVNSIETAKQVVWKLRTDYRNFVHACDTEVTKVDLKKETRVDHGEIISFSIHSFDGERKADFGDGKCCIWVDVLDGEGCTSGAKNLLMEFAPFFEDKSIKKVWHNYSFDGHIIQNYGIKLAGFHADTMHMARLWDSNRRVDGGYSLEALTSNKEVMDGKPGRAVASSSSKTTGMDCAMSSYSGKSNELGFPKLHNTPQPIGKQTTSSFTEDDYLNIAKASMKSIFSRYKLRKDGKEGRITTVDAVEILQREDRDLWICYSALDSISTGRLFKSLKKKLEARDWVCCGKEYGNMFEFYQKLWRPFGELLVQMEREGMYVNRSHLKEIEKIAIAEQRIAGDKFRRWASKYCADAKYMNVGSDPQVQQLLFGGALNSQDHNECLPEERNFKVLNSEPDIKEGKKKLTKHRTITLRKIGEGTLSTEIHTSKGWPSVSADALKVLAGKIPSEIIYGENGDSEELLDKVGYGTAFDAFGGGEEGKEACIAIAALCEICSIDSLLSNFIRPLQENQISCKKGRIHCSLNINTETGRLSSRTPNLQNQPALEKDRYKIRQAFVAEPGNSLIVADYGQLELRILAHLTGCKSMLKAFKDGGDFHSRTAMNMYDYISKAVKENKVLLEWKPHPGEDKPPLPLLKDVYGAERRKAKMLNFSLAYGKTAMGLAQDWKVSIEEAKDTLKRWYKGRSEVKMWQKEQKMLAREEGFVRTLLGRERHFPKIDNLTGSQRGHIDRAAINTPVQGSAADVAMCAMLEINANSRLKELGWRLLLQVHDEVILEGPTESAEEARSIVVECMSKPFNGVNILDVDLVVDAKCAKSWYEAK